MNLPEWTGQDLTDAQRKTAFGNGDNELGLTVLRIFVNPDSNQWSRAVPTAKYASDNGVTVFASPWEPPANLAEKYPDSNIGKLHLPESNYGAYAQHLNNFGTYMKNNGVDVYSVSVQNEPDYSSEWTHWTTDELTNFIANYGDKITSTRLMSPESFQYSPDGASWIDHGTGDGGKRIYKKILNNEKAFANCDLFGTHFYGTQRSWMDYPELENCGKEIWMTEVYVPNSDKDSANRYPEALQVSENIHNAMVVSNMSAYTWWYIRRNYGLMTEDGKISKRGYCMAHYSKFVRPGAKRIEATESPADNVLISAYKSDDNSKITVVAINKGTDSYAQEFALPGAKITDVDRYRTSANENLALTENLENDGDSFFAQILAESVSSFVITLDGGTPSNPNPDPVPTPDENGYYFHSTFEDGEDSWTGHGGATVTISGRTPYKDTEALLVQERTSAWNGVERKLDSAVFEPGKEYSFSSHVIYLDGSNTQKFFMKLQYTDSNGDARYATIAEATAIKGEYVQLANTNYRIPEDAENMVLYIETEEGTDNFYIDEAIGAVGGTVIEGEGAKTIVLGDVDMNGSINVLDLSAAKKGLSKGFGSVAGEICADVDRSGTVDTTDIELLQKYIIGMIKEFPVNESQDPTPSVNSQVTPTAFMISVRNSLSEFALAGSTDEKSGVQYGTLTKHQYYSTTRERMTDVNVLLPAGYNENETYPVLYALHGYWENEDSLVGMSKAQNMLGNLIASGEAKKMIVVFPYIYTSKTQESCSGMDLQNSLNYDNFINDLTTDLMPYINSNFSVKTGRENTAVTGFSMGGREALFIGLTRSDLFGYVGAACPAPGLTPGADLSMHPGQLQESQLKAAKDEPYLVMITAGTNDGVVGSSPESYHNILTTNGADHVWHTVTGGAHDASSVQPHFYNYLRHIFKATN